MWLYRLESLHIIGRWIWWVSVFTTAGVFFVYRDWFDRD